MMKTKIATDLEQSKRLLELGLDTKTADMYYHVFSTEVPICEPFDGQDLQIPCWSLSALLYLMPKPIKLNDNFAYPHVDLFNQSIDYFVGMAIYKTIKGKTLIDAAVEMVEWLITNKYLEV